MSNSALSEPDRKALDFIRSYSARHGRAPSYSEVGEHIGLPHPNNAKRNCDRLVARGLIARDEIGNAKAGRPRALRLAESAGDLVFPFRGPVSCGEPSEPADLDDTIDIRSYLKDGNLAVFRARGSSMIDAHIADGDLLFVSEQPDPPVGSVVVAMLDRELVCKRLARKGKKRVRLEPCNGAVAPIEFDPAKVHFRVLGILHSVLRKV